MKKVLLIGFVLAICVLAFPQGVMAADVIVNANVLSSVTSFSVTGPGTTWDLNYGPGNILRGALQFQVTAHGNWDITVADMESDTQGHLTPYSGGYYDPTQALFYPLGVGSVTDLTTTAQTLTSGTGSPDPFSEDLTQVLNSSDLSGPNYRIVLTFDCVAAP